MISALVLAAIVGGRLDVPSGPGSTATDIGIGSWGVLTAYGSTRFGDAGKLESWIELPLVMWSPANQQANTLGGVLVGAGYPVGGSVETFVEVGLLNPGMMQVNPFVLPTFVHKGKKSPGLAMGFAWTARGASTELRVAPAVVVQKNSDRIATGMDTAVDVAEATAQLEVKGTYRASKTIALGLVTGVWSGNNLEFTANEGMTVPAVVEFDYGPGPTHYGVRIGAANVVPAEGVGVGKTLYGGLYVRHDLSAETGSAERKMNRRGAEEEEAGEEEEEEQEEAPPAADDEDPIFED